MDYSLDADDYICKRMDYDGRVMVLDELLDLRERVKQYDEALEHNPDVVPLDFDIHGSSGICGNLSEFAGTVTSSIAWSWPESTMAGRSFVFPVEGKDAYFAARVNGALWSGTIGIGRRMLLDWLIEKFETYLTY